METMQNIPIYETAQTIEFPDPEIANALFGSQNEHLAFFAKRSGIAISSKGTTLYLQGTPEACAQVANLLKQLYSLYETRTPLHPRDLPHAYTILQRDPNADLKSIFLDPVFIASKRKTITAKTLSQKEYINALRTKDMTFGVGPAGTGKTYLAVAVALSMLSANRIKRIILTRPAVEAGERLGFLPGDLTQKVDPYLRPLYDALYDMLDAAKVVEMLEANIIEVAPLAFMRGRTLNDAFIILDEAQNTTIEQMKMFVTRLGFSSKAAITGDITQIDLPKERGRVQSGLIHALNILDDVDGIAITHFHKEDVIRHPLVGRIIEAYDSYNQTHPR